MSAWIRAGGIEREVPFEQPGPDAADAVTGAYRVKYPSHGANILGTVISAEAVRSTLRLVPA
jgi:hypothetical protein